MDNPFKKRATEFFEDAATFLSLVSPQPIKQFFEGNAAQFFDRLVTVIGTPGSGKTTIAKLLELDLLAALTRSSNSDYRDLIAVLQECGVLQDLLPRYLAYRLPSSSNLREIWELPYSESLRGDMLQSLIQAKAVLGWFRQLERENIDLDSVKIISRKDSEAQQNLLRVNSAIAFRELARDVEEQIYKVITSLIPPSEQELSAILTHGRFDAFQLLEGLRLPPRVLGNPAEFDVGLLLTIDDAHELHPEQFAAVERWLQDRELRVARWMITRIDAIGYQELRTAMGETDNAPAPGTLPGRDRIIKPIQRRNRDRSFRGVARDISRRYLEQMPVLRRRGVRSLDDWLDATPPSIAPGQLKELEARAKAVERDLNTSPARLSVIKNSIPTTLPTDAWTATYRILLHREMKHRPQIDMFGDDADNDDGEEETPAGEPRQVRSSLLEGADIQLMHEYDRPFYFGFDRLADSSNDNIEQFVNLAGALVEIMETRVIRGRDPRLNVKDQHAAVIERATKTIESWDFPHSVAVRKLVDFIARRCIERTMEPNAPLDDGANAYGVPQAEMDQLHKLWPDLEPILHFAVAYNAIVLREKYECKKKIWCLMELGGLPIIANRLTLHKGGFYEGQIAELSAQVAS